VFRTRDAGIAEGRNKIMKLYVLQPSNQYKMALMVNFEEDFQLLGEWGWKSLRQIWRPLKYTLNLKKTEKRNGAVNHPDICKCNSPGVLFRANLVNEIFPDRIDEIELLPVLVDGEDWLFINCLKTTEFYDKERSKFLRDAGENGQIFMIQHVVVTDSSVKDVELFTIADSNRVWIIATESFVDRIKKIGINGLDFREIGSLECS
jgi:hypothetical protein